MTSRIFEKAQTPAPYKPLLLAIGLMQIACFTMAATWEEQQAYSESTTADYLAQNPGVRSDRFVFKTIELPEGGTVELDLRIERPLSGENLPVVFYVHGGGWITGSKAHFCHQSFALANAGIAGVRMEYRWMSMGGEFNNVIGDVMDAIQFIRERAGELGLDFTRVGLAGGSAGGHLGAIAAQRTPECISFDGFNGLYDAWERDGSAFGGGDFTGTTEEEKKAASAIYQIKENPPHTWLYHGSEDTTITIQQSERFAAAVLASGGSAALLAYEGVGHSFFNAEPYRTLTTDALLAHVSHVFGLTAVVPSPEDYLPTPELGLKPVGFTLPGAWLKEGNPAEAYTFLANGSATSTSGDSLQWFESNRNYYLVNSEGLSLQINPLSRARIRIEETDYIRADGPTGIIASGKGSVDAASSATTSFAQRSELALELSDYSVSIDLQHGQTYAITGSMTLTDSIYPNIWNDKLVLGIANPSGTFFPSAPNLVTTGFSLLARIPGATSPNAPVEIAQGGSVIYTGTLGNDDYLASRQVGFSINITLAQTWENESAGEDPFSHAYELALDYNNDGLVDHLESGSFLTLDKATILLGFGVIQGGNRGTAELLSNAWTFEVHDGPVALLPEAPSPELCLSLVAEDQMKVTWFAGSGFDYQILLSSDLRQWTPHGPSRAGMDSFISDEISIPAYPIFVSLSYSN